MYGHGLPARRLPQNQSGGFGLRAITRGHLRSSNLGAHGEGRARGLKTAVTANAAAAQGVAGQAPIGGPAAGIFHNTHYAIILCRHFSVLVRRCRRFCRSRNYPWSLSQMLQSFSPARAGAATRPAHTPPQARKPPTQSYPPPSNPDPCATYRLALVTLPALTGLVLSSLGTFTKGSGRATAQALPALAFLVAAADLLLGRSAQALSCSAWSRVSFPPLRPRCYPRFAFMV